MSTSADWDQIWKRDWSAEARGIIRGTFNGKVTRYHVLALSYEIEDLRALIERIHAARGFEGLPLNLCIEIERIRHLGRLAAEPGQEPKPIAPAPETVL